jgi:hypothetical protein
MPESLILRKAGLFWVKMLIIISPTRKGRGTVPGIDTGYREPAADPRREGRFSRDYFGRKAFLTVSRQFGVHVGFLTAASF